MDSRQYFSVYFLFPSSPASPSHISFKLWRALFAYTKSLKKMERKFCSTPSFPKPLLFQIYSWEDALNQEAAISHLPSKVTSMQCFSRKCSHLETNCGWEEIKQYIYLAINLDWEYRLPGNLPFPYRMFQLQLHFLSVAVSTLFSSRLRKTRGG